MEFDPKLPGTGAIFRRALEDVIADVAERAAKAAAARALLDEIFIARREIVTRR